MQVRFVTFSLINLEILIELWEILFSLSIRIDLGSSLPDGVILMRVQLHMYVYHIFGAFSRLSSRSLFDGVEHDNLGFFTGSESSDPQFYCMMTSWRPYCRKNESTVTTTIFIGFS